MPATNNRDITLPEIDIPAPGRAGQTFCLTVLYHPDVSRIGDRLQMFSVDGPASLKLQRLGPHFSNAAAQAGAPLDDPYLSRAPLHFRRHPHGLKIDASGHGSSVVVAGQSLKSSRLLSEEDISQGVSIMLARRIVLYLHYGLTEHQAGQDYGMVGQSASLQRVRDLVSRAAQGCSPVLLLGESGTGKELLAKAIHSSSERACCPWVPVNMAAVPAELAAAELFGVCRGAYTGADQDRAGYFQQAQSGTLFLDEIGDCPASVQPLLLRALQEGEIQLSGGKLQKVDVRIIAATDSALDDGDTQFSVALRHRLGSFELHIPALRHRREDIGLLLRHALPQLLPESSQLSALCVGQWAMLVQDMASYGWPGNVRELLNVCQQIAAASLDENELCIPDHVLRQLRSDVEDGAAGETSYLAAGAEPTDSEIREAMALAQWEVARAARRLEMSRQTLYHRIESIADLRVVANIASAEIEAMYHDCGGELHRAANRMQVSLPALRRRWRALDLTPVDC